MQNECADRMCAGAERMCRTETLNECAERRCYGPMCRTNVQSNVAKRITNCRSIFDPNPTPYERSRWKDGAGGD